MQLREGVVEVRDVQRLRTGEPVRERERAAVAKLSLFKLGVVLVAVCHHPEVLGNLGVVRPEHVLQTLQRSLVRSLRRGCPVELIAYLRQSHERRHDRVHVCFLVPGSFSRFPHANRVSRELPSHLEVPFVQLNLANLGDNLGYHRGLRPDQ